MSKQLKQFLVKKTNQFDMQDVKKQERIKEDEDKELGDGKLILDDVASNDLLRRTI